jgi:hypothetical protein
MVELEGRSECDGQRAGAPFEVTHAVALRGAVATTAAAYLVLRLLLVQHLLHLQAEALACTLEWGMVGAWQAVSANHLVRKREVPAQSPMQPASRQVYVPGHMASFSANQPSTMGRASPAIFDCRGQKRLLRKDWGATVWGAGHKA